MDFFDAVEGRRSIREFAAEEVPEADMERILDAGRRAPSGKNIQPIEFIVIRDAATLAKLDEVQKVFASAGARAAVAIVADPGASRFWLEDASAAATQMLLAAHALGYGSVWIEGTLQPKEEFARELLGIPEGKRPVILLPVGRAAAPREPKAKKPLGEMTYRERYGQR